PHLLDFLQGKNVVHRYGRVQTLQGKLAQVLDIHLVLDAPEDALRDEDLPGIRFAAQARGEIVHRADHAVVLPPAETDRADGGIALRDADAAADLESHLLPAPREAADAFAQV